MSIQFIVYNNKIIKFGPGTSVKGINITYINAAIASKTL